MSTKLVSDNQGKHLALLARQRGITRDEWEARRADLTAVLDAIKKGEKITIGTPVTPPANGRIHLLTLAVNPGTSWEEAVRMAGPNTGSDWDIWKVGDLYPPTTEKPEEIEYVLVNFGPGSITTGPTALAWAKQFGLTPSTPRDVFAVSALQPGLRKELGLEYMGILSTTPCELKGYQQVPYGWSSPDFRNAGLDWFGRDLNVNYWFLFRKPKK